MVTYKSLKKKNSKVINFTAKKEVSMVKKSSCTYKCYITFLDNNIL